MIMRHFTSLTQDMIRQDLEDPGIFNNNLMISMQDISCQTAQSIQQWKSSIKICSMYKVIKTSLVVVIDLTSCYCSHTVDAHKL